MEITVEILRKIRKVLDKYYDEEGESYSELVDVHDIIDSLKELEYIKGEIDILQFLEYILEDDSEAIRVLEEYLKEA